MIECGREADVFEAVAFGRWPSHTAPDLQAHVVGCPICRDVVAVAAAMQDDRRRLIREAEPPTAAIIWWRATIRARAEAAHAAMRPMTMWQAVAGTCVAALTAAIAAGVWRSGIAGSAAADLVARLAISRAGSPLAGFGIEQALLVLAGVVACIVLAPIALYFALADD